MLTHPDPAVSRRARRLRRTAAAVALGLLALRCAAVEPVDVPTVRNPLTSIKRFWDLNPEVKARPIPFRLECDVTYYDPEWKILFIQDKNGDGAYVPSSELDFPFEPNTHLLAVGQFVPPNFDITFNHAVITKMGPSQAAAVDSSGIIDRLELGNNRLITAEGVVDRAVRFDATHIKLFASIEGRAVIIWIPSYPRSAIPDLDNTAIHLEGVFTPKLDTNGKTAWLEILVSDLNHIRVLNRIEDDPRFDGPAVPIPQLPSLPHDRIAHVRGTVNAQEPGKTLSIRDDAGQVEVVTGQVRQLPVGSAVEAVGYPVIKGTVLQLQGGIFRAIHGVPRKPPEADSTLRLVGQITELSSSEASKGKPVDVTGVVTWTEPDEPYLFIQDSSGGIRVKVPGVQPSSVYPSANIEVRGITDMGDYAPVILATSLQKVSDMVLPVADPETLERALTGAQEANWVQMSGYLRRAVLKDAVSSLEVVAPSGEFSAEVQESADLSPMVGGFIRLQGVCTAVTNSDHKIAAIRLLVPGMDYVQVEQPPPRSPFEVPLKTLIGLGSYGTARNYNQLLRVTGTVVFDSPGHQIELEDGGEVLLVLSSSPERLEPGDRIEAAGILARRGSRILLKESVFRKVGKGQMPEARPVSDDRLPVAGYDGHLVRMAATLVDSYTGANELRLFLQGENAVFDAVLENPGSDAPRLRPGSKVSVTGMYQVNYDEFDKPASYHLHLRQLGDIRVLAQPPWLTRGRVLAIAGTLLAGIVLFIAWVTVLRRRVRFQTSQIREQLSRESRLQAELIRTSKLESLGLLAGGIAHDFNNLLTVVMANLSLARMGHALDQETITSLEDAEKAAVRARDLTQQLLTFAKGGLPVQAAVLVPDVVREVAEFALRGSKVRCAFDIPEGLWPANADKGQLGQVVQNIVINAMQAMPDGGTVGISIRNETVSSRDQHPLDPGRYLHLQFEDHGTGIRPEDIEKVFDPYFTTKKQGSGLGLATVHSIVKKHRGRVLVESMPGMGTTFHVWLPAADKEPGAEGQAAGSGAATPAPAGARILFMDDEASIRKVAASILSRLGYEVTPVADGLEAVAEYRAAREAGRPYALVILDLTVPGGTGGTQALQQLLRIDPNVCAIVSSGYSNDAVLSDYRAHGFKGMVSKPYEIADLALAIERVLRGGTA